MEGCQHCVFTHRLRRVDTTARRKDLVSLRCSEAPSKRSLLVSCFLSWDIKVRTDNVTARDVERKWSEIFHFMPSSRLTGYLDSEAQASCSRSLNRFFTMVLSSVKWLSRWTCTSCSYPLNQFNQCNVAFVAELYRCHCPQRSRFLQMIK